MRIHNSCTLMILILSFSVSAETDHQSAPMLSQPTKPISTIQSHNTKPPAPQPNAVNMETGEEFREIYADAGEPRIAIFWNQEFDDRLSQWETISRTSSSYNRGYGRQLAFQYSEVLAEKRKRKGMNERDNFELNAGFVGTLVDNNVNVIDRASIMRLAERNKAMAAETEIISDYKKIEADALAEYADLLCEVLFHPDNDAEIGFSFLVNIREMETGRVIAKFASNAQPTKTQKISKTIYITTAEGYKKKTIVEKVHSRSLRTSGEQLAFDTMRALTDILGSH